MRAGAYRILASTLEASIVEDADHVARRSRNDTIERWMHEGLLTYVPEIGGNGIPIVNPKRVKVRVGDYVFSDKFQDFPSTKLVAEVGLAIHAGVDKQKVGPENG